MKFKLLEYALFSVGIMTFKLFFSEEIDFEYIIIIGLIYLAAKIYHIEKKLYSRKTTE